MPQRYEPIEIRPTQGGGLASNFSTDTTGILNYTRKENFRRYLDRELRREGHDYFEGNTDIELGSQPFPYQDGTDIAVDGNWGGMADKIPVKKGWFYKYVPGDNEDHAIHGEDGSRLEMSLVVLLDGYYKQYDGNADVDEAIAKATRVDGRLISHEGNADMVYAKSDDDFRRVWATNSPPVDGPVYEVYFNGQQLSAYVRNPGGDWIDIDDTDVFPWWTAQEQSAIGVIYSMTQAEESEIWIYPEAEAAGDPRTYQLIEFAPITLIHEARRPNGQKAIVVGTPTTLYRYFALENGEVFEDGVFDSPPEPNAPCFSGDLGDWIILATGFDPDAQRWEAVSINGDSIFNNGRDPVFTYRVEQISSKAVYELRESGVAAVGCIAEYFGILNCADISEIQADKFLELFDPIGVTRSVAKMASQTGNTVTSTGDIFDTENRTIVFADGTRKNTVAYTNPKETFVDGDPDEVPLQPFTLRVQAHQIGSFFSAPSVATQLEGSPDVTSASPVFDIAHVGMRMRYVNGWSSVVLAFVDVNNITLTDPAPMDLTNLPFFMVSEPHQASVDFKVFALAPIFTADMVGRNISWDDGTVRRIVGFIDAQNVYVDADMAIENDIIGIDNPATYAAYTAREFINRVAYRRIWSMEEKPTRFDPIYKGSMEAGSFILKLDQPAKSVKIGDQLIVAGAGTAGVNVSGTVVYVAANRVIALDQRAARTVVSVPVEKADAADSIVGFEEIQDDTSGIIAMLELDGSLVIYKDTAVAYSRFTGNVEKPFQTVLRRISSSHALFYRNTLVLVNNAMHLYAGRNSFYRLTSVDQFPREVPELEVCKDKFFSRAALENSKWIFAANNILTKEIFIGNFPYTGSDRVLCIDYLTQPMTVSTSDMTISAAASVKRPIAGAVVGELEDWFLMGTPMGVMLLYGLVTLQSATFGGALSVFYRREKNPYDATKISYPSCLKSGLSAFGSASSEKDMRSWVALLSSKSPQTQILFRLYGTRNPVEAPALLVETLVPADENLVSLFCRQHYFQDEITIAEGVDNPLELVMRIMEISGVRSKSFTRRPT